MKQKKPTLLFLEWIPFKIKDINKTLVSEKEYAFFLKDTEIVYGRLLKEKSKYYLQIDYCEYLYSTIERKLSNILFFARLKKLISNEEK